MLLYTHFYNNFLNVLRPTFFNICNLPFSHFPKIRKIRVKFGPKTNCFSYFMSSCTVRIVAFNNFIFTDIWPTNRQTKTFPQFSPFQLLFEFFFELFSCKIRSQNSSNYCNKKMNNALLEKNTGTVLCSNLLEMCLQSLKLNV